MGIPHCESSDHLQKADLFSQSSSLDQQPLAPEVTIVEY